MIKVDVSKIEEVISRKASQGRHGIVESQTIFFSFFSFLSFDQLPEPLKGRIMTRMDIVHILQPNDDIGPASHRVIIGEHPRQDGFEAILTRMFCKNSLERCLMSLVVLALVLAIATCEKSSGISETAIGPAPVVLQVDKTTFIWGNQAAAQSGSGRPASAFNSIPAASINRFWNEPSQLELQRQPQARRDRIAAARGRVAVRGRLAATQRAAALVEPLGFDIRECFISPFRIPFRIRSGSEI